MPILKEPKFRERKDFPTTDAADVNENIDNWLDNKTIGGRGKEQLASVCRRDPKGHRGYRFVTSVDFDEEHTVIQKVLGVELTIQWIRKYTRSDSLNPFWYKIWYTSKHITLPDGEQFTWCSDADLKRNIERYKTRQSQLK